MTERTPQARLCPHCANSIPESAAKCPFCKATLSPTSSEQWPSRPDAGSELVASKGVWPKTATIALVAGVVLFAIGVFLVGRSTLRGSDGEALKTVLEQRANELKEREQKIEALETDVIRLRKELEDSSNETSRLRTQLEASRRELAAAEQKFNSALREADRLAMVRKQQSAPAPAPSAKAPPPPAPRRTAEPGVYETVRATNVYEEPAESSRVVSKVNKGTRVNVVRSAGEWLEVRSKHGKPPGFIRLDDVMFINRTD